MNLTEFSDDTCTVSTKTTIYKLEQCKKETIALCSADGTNATFVWYDDTDTTCKGAVNSTKSYVGGKCTATGPKGSKKGKIAVCY